MIIERHAGGNQERLASPEELNDLLMAAVNFAKQGNERRMRSAVAWTNAVYVVDSGEVLLVCAFENNGIIDGAIISDLLPVIEHDHSNNIVLCAMEKHAQICMGFDSTTNRWSFAIRNSTQNESEINEISQTTAQEIINLLKRESSNKRV